MAADMDKDSSTTAEFSRIVLTEQLEQGEVSETISAREDERQALAARFGLVSLDSLRADVALARVGHGPIVRVEGRLFADVVQTCVVSLEPVKNRIEEDFVIHYAPETRGENRGEGHGKGQPRTIELRLDEDDEEDFPEPLVGGRIDIGETVAQHLALALDPYPRKPGIRLEDVIAPGKGVSIGEASENPFAVLARLSRQNS